MNYEHILRRGLAIVLCFCMAIPYLTLAGTLISGKAEQTEALQTPTETVPESTETETNPVDTEPEPTEPPVTEPMTPTEPTYSVEIGVTYFDIPLDRDLQDHIFKLCEENNLDPIMVLAVIRKESSYRSQLMGDNGDAYGLMQVQQKHHQDRMDRLGVTDLLDPYQNVTVGIDFLSELSGRGKPLEWVLMAYNGGASYANRKWEAGEVTSYVTKVLSNMIELEQELIRNSTEATE